MNKLTFKAKLNFHFLDTVFPEITHSIEHAQNGICSCQNTKRNAKDSY